MNKEEVFKEILKSPKLKEFLGVPLNQELDTESQIREIRVIKNIIYGSASPDNIFKSITKLYDI